MTKKIIYKELPDMLPIFPLPGVIVLPNGNLPLNIFEPRYIDMVKTCLSKSEGFCIVLSKPDHQKNNDLPGHHDIATYVEIIDFDQLDNVCCGADDCLWCFEFVSWTYEIFEKIWLEISSIS